MLKKINNIISQNVLVFTFLLKHRAKVKNFMRHDFLHTDKLEEFDLNSIAVQGVILDFDGVLAAYGEVRPRDDVLLWLKYLQSKYANIAILTNKPMDSRQDFFLKNFPGFTFISGANKKPDPDGINMMSKLWSIPTSKIAMVDDRLTTGVLAAISIGAVPIWLKTPIVDYRKRPIIEAGFAILRFFDKLLFRF
jgi:predicted HAD superfamily phosphohydrolase YqeG